MSTIKEFEATIGRFVLAWADMELGLDLLALSVRLIAAPAERKQKLPSQLSTKIEFIRKETRKHSSLGARQAVIDCLLNEIEALSETRHDFVHGAVIDHYLSRSEITVTMARLLQPNKGPRRAPVKVTNDEIEKTSNRIHTLSESLLDLVEALNAELVRPR